jgi:hypothetical protein
MPNKADKAIEEKRKPIKKALRVRRKDKGVNKSSFNFKKANSALLAECLGQKLIFL